MKTKEKIKGKLILWSTVGICSTLLMLGQVSAEGGGGGGGIGGNGSSGPEPSSWLFSLVAFTVLVSIAAYRSYTRRSDISQE